ncbi:Eukaryotic translation initiation factor isoform 4G-2 [Durusdinium trenchii]|uniref:Tetratricopeptide repeat protein 29 n=1 Tax=Durusdinium trenchii TaxID=1381693 RepID=A0ABP0QIG6_9DINO
MAPEPYTGLDQVQIYRHKAETEGSEAEKEVWQLLATGLDALNEDDPDVAIERGHQAIAKAKQANCTEGDAEGLLLVTRALTSINSRKEGDKLARAQLADAKLKKDKSMEAKALLAVAEVNADQRGSKKREEARVAGKQSYDFFLELGDLRGQAAALLVQSHVCIKSKNQDKEKRSAEALTLASEARRISGELKDQRTEASCLHAIASAYDIIDQHTECILFAEEALDLYLDLQDPYAEGFELCCMAQWFLNHGRHVLAVAYAEDALEILRKAPKASASQELRALQLLSQAHEGRGDTTGLSAVHESLKRFQNTNNQSAEAAAMDMLLRSHCDKGEYKEALEIAERARTAFKSIGDEASEANVSALSAGLHLKLHMPDEALKIGYEVMDLVRRSGSTKQKSDLMMTLAQAYLEKQQPYDALDMCNDMQQFFADKGDVEGEAEALLAAGSLHVLQDDLDQAREKAVKAQLMLSEEGLASGEGRALRLLAEIYAKQEQHKAAIRAGERSRALLRGEENPAEEASMLFLVAQEAVQLAVAEGARVGSDKPLKKHARDALDKAEKSARTAMKLCKESAKQQGITEVLGSSLCSLSQVHMLRSKYQEALSVAQEASQLFKAEGYARNQGSACMLCADAYRAMENYKESQRVALEAVNCFRLCDPPDERGLEAAQQVLDALKQHLAPAPTRAYAGAPGAGGLPPQMLLSSDGDEEEATETRVARPRSTGPALDIKNLHPDLVKKKILEVALSLTGAAEDEIEVDTPLMEAGLTSSMAVGLSDELKKDLPGINLPVTLVFDYPSISAMAELILEGD